MQRQNQTCESNMVPPRSDLHGEWSGQINENDQEGSALKPQIAQSHEQSRLSLPLTLASCCTRTMRESGSVSCSILLTF